MINIFISYSYQDEEWKDRLLSKIRVLGKEGLVSIRENRQIEKGQDWSTEIEKALREADIVILLISADYLTSDFILNEEIPSILERSEKKGLKVLPVIVRPCPWRMVPWLSKAQVFPEDGVPLASVDEYQIEDKLTKLVSMITTPRAIYELESSSAHGLKNFLVYRVTITAAREVNLFEIRWIDIRRGSIDYFMQSAPDFGDQYPERWQQNEDEALDTGEKLFLFLNGDGRYLERALDESALKDTSLLLFLSTCEGSADWPFELLAKDKRFLLLERVHLVRCVSEWGKEKKHKSADDRPLRLLFMACSALDVQPELDYEKEEEALVSATEGLPIDLEAEDSGSLQGLGERLLHEYYDVVHLSGHADIDKNGRPVFLMEDEYGKA
ncbi:MAG: toll/interleukin-1 receptor domain-containing protein, partial [Candidatus Aminicenantes bacterium]|nr:toll/interleukin-1 receptor domain-containing protein [Candidatus Aminicenantes bacterium]